MSATSSCASAPRNPSLTSASTHRDLHNLSADITFPASIIAPFVAARQLRGTRFARLSLVLGLLALAFALVTASYGDRQPGDPVGLLQRLLLLVVGAWFVLAALEVRRER